MGTELLIGVVLGFVVLGPRRMYAMLGPLRKAKAQFDKASRELKSQLAVGLEGGDRPTNREPPADLDSEAAGAPGLP